jgi:hypothetical protein
MNEGDQEMKYIELNEIGTPHAVSSTVNAIQLTDGKHPKNAVPPLQSSA